MVDIKMTNNSHFGPHVVGQKSPWYAHGPQTALTCDWMNPKASSWGRRRAHGCVGHMWYLRGSGLLLVYFVSVCSPLLQHSDCPLPSWKWSVPSRLFLILTPLARPSAHFLVLIFTSVWILSAVGFRKLNLKDSGKASLLMYIIEMRG